MRRATRVEVTRKTVRRPPDTLPATLATVGVYESQILPRCINLIMAGADLGRLRTRVASGLSGDVLEIGFGSGRNVPYYPPGLTHVWAVDPATAGRKLAAKRVAASPVPIEYVGLDAQTLPLDDQSVDHVLSTWTLCTIPDVSTALAEVRRVLRPGGALHFIEHGLAPDAKMARRQARRNPLNRRVFGGCHLNRPIDRLVSGAGFEVTRLSTYYHRRPAADSYTYEGVATKPPSDLSAVENR
jgi:SAM-dependent methyltransferase